MLDEGLALFLCAVLGFAALAVPMDRHWRDLIDGRRGPGRRTLVGLRCAAALLLGTALVLAIHRDGLGFGLLLWTLALSAAALAVSAVVSVMTARMMTTQTVARRRDGSGRAG